MWNITIFHPLPHVLGNTQPSAEHPMICDFVVLTATNEQAPNATTTNGFHGFRLEYTRRLAAAEDRRLAHTACLLNFSPVAETQLGKNEAKVIKYRAVLHALGMINRKRILSPPYTAQKPPILLLDDNTFVTNTHMTIFDLFRRIDMGCTYMPAAEQFCEPLLGGECNLPSSGKAATPKTRMKKYASERYHPDFFFIANLEADCYTPWAISAGALVFKPHTLSKLLLEAIILTAVSGVQHQFYGYDQGSLNFALSELFNVDHNKLRNLCYPYSEEFWNMSTGGDQLIFDVELNQGNLESHFIFNILHKKYQKALAELDRSSRLGDRALIVNPRWLAPPACPGYLNHKQRSALSWHAQDFIARFNGCDGGKAIHSDVFVKRASSDLALLPLSDGKLRMSGTFRAQPLEDPTARPWAVLSP
eukprot:Gregarina_sp_Pseudo_9__1502@NODE_200_length_3633_cov_55_060935_g185_i0_p2_GENE_NODE_200_length_3633_cov_55_060935_g185_i0NODE_200_length_3633_cov_55_060935_g185_i0_p2_ORF_typecomplete_len419_score34_58Glyco_transf_34/PF05637_12/0_0095_NODE_200_length_3633_cov_55_060935_g185_i021903446